jgi:lysophospholipase L1-like esterase
VRKLAGKHKDTLVDTQPIFDTMLAHKPFQDLSGDHVHSTMTGHMILARAFLQAVGYVW